MTRRYSIEGQGDKTLCDVCQRTRIEGGQRLGVPSDAASFMFGMKPWPSGEERCDDCGA